MKDTTIFADSELLLAPTDTKMAKVLEEAVKLAKKRPEILARIEQDQDAHAKLKKISRVEDQRWYEAQTLPLPMEDLLANTETDDVELEVGRPRLPAMVLFLFLCLRGCYGSVCSESSWDRLVDSMTLRFYLRPYIARIPGRTTVLENLNAVSNETRDFIVDCQLAAVLEESLDDFGKQTIDSTSAHGNSAWPTEVHVIQKLLGEAYRLGQSLEQFGLPNFRQWHVLRWLNDLDSLEFSINLKSRRDRRAFKKSYRRFVKRAGQIADFLGGEYDRLDDLIASVNVAPSIRRMLNRLWERLQQDLSESYTLLEFTSDRVLGSGRTEREEHERIYSVSDRSSSFIVKGGRETVFGYKIQLGRSENGFITSVLVPEGNAADSDQLVPMVVDHIARTGVIPKLVSADDGYSSAIGREQVQELGVPDVSLSGSKGKKLTPVGDWESDTYTQARNDRSAVESLMFTGKHGFEFGQFHRRGIDAVRGEMLEKTIAYNFWRMNYERRRQEENSKKNKRQRLRKAA